MVVLECSFGHEAPAGDRLEDVHPPAHERKPGSTLSHSPGEGGALITHYLVGPTTAIITTAIVVVAFALIWFALPLRRRRLRRRLGR
jgi:hypothetical protein